MQQPDKLFRILLESRSWTEASPKPSRTMTATKPALPGKRPHAATRHPGHI